MHCAQRSKPGHDNRGSVRPRQSVDRPGERTQGSVCDSSHLVISDSCGDPPASFPARPWQQPTMHVGAFGCFGKLARRECLPGAGGAANSLRKQTSGVGGSQWLSKGLRSPRKCPSNLDQRGSSTSRRNPSSASLPGTNTGYQILLFGGALATVSDLSWQSLATSRCKRSYADCHWQSNILDELPVAILSFRAA
jgi:hypothetical protein